MDARIVATLAAAVPAGIVAVQEAPPNDPVDVTWAVVLSFLIRELIDYFRRRRDKKRR